MRGEVGNTVTGTPVAYIPAALRPGAMVIGATNSASTYRYFVRPSDGALYRNATIATAMRISCQTWRKPPVV